MEKTKKRIRKSGPRSRWCARCRRIMAKGQGKFAKRRNATTWSPTEARQWNAALALEARRKREAEGNHGR